MEPIVDTLDTTGLNSSIVLHYMLHCILDTAYILYIKVTSSRSEVKSTAFLSEVEV